MMIVNPHRFQGLLKRLVIEKFEDDSWFALHGVSWPDDDRVEVLVNASKLPRDMLLERDGYEI